jgi:hypothetical protein
MSILHSVNWGDVCLLLERIFVIESLATSFGDQRVSKERQVLKDIIFWLYMGTTFTIL